MKNIKTAFILLGVGLSALWLLADTLAPTPFTYFAFRTVFVQYTGVLAIGAMSVAMLLAVRPLWLERPLHGLDKMYRLHKWLGIAALVLSVLHWWWAQGSKWMVGWGWLTRPPRNQSGPAPELAPLEQWLRNQRGWAESLGEWAFYAAVVLIVLALVKAFPYHWFKKMHQWLALVYLVLAYHTVVLAKFAYWTQPVGWALALLLLAGTASALLVLAGRVGRQRQVQGTVLSLTPYAGVQALAGCVQLDSDRWPGHRPGQFAFVTSSRRESAHPYTIASAWNPQQRRLTFIVKALGDWTGQLPQRLAVGMPVTVEGPYGCFDFDDAQPRQIWIGAGIGITPFIARMQHLAQCPGTQQIDLFHVTAEVDAAALAQLSADAQAANVRLHLRITPQDGRLTPEHIRAAVPEWRSASLWFCGPAAFGQALRDDFVRQGWSADHYHQELFDMR